MRSYRTQQAVAPGWQWKRHGSATDGILVILGKNSPFPLIKISPQIQNKDFTRFFGKIWDFRLLAFSSGRRGTGTVDEVYHNRNIVSKISQKIVIKHISGWVIFCVAKVQNSFAPHLIRHNRYKYRLCHLPPLGKANAPYFSAIDRTIFMFPSAHRQTLCTVILERSVAQW